MLVLVPRCALPSPNNQYCGRCLTKPPLRDLISCLYIYQDEVSRLITGFKFHQHHFLSRFFSQQLALKRLSLTAQLPELLIPIPLHPARIKERDYNQANELAKDLSRQLSLPMDNKILRRIKNTRPQTSLSYSQRRKNLKQAFELVRKPPAQHIALIDDVLTTGHTLETAVKLLKSAGVKTVEVWTIARTIRHDARQG
jgi:ComF family protein